MYPTNSDHFAIHCAMQQEISERGEMQTEYAHRCQRGTIATRSRRTHASTGNRASQIQIRTNIHPHTRNNYMRTCIIAHKITLPTDGNATKTHTVTVSQTAACYRTRIRLRIQCERRVIWKIEKLNNRVRQSLMQPPNHLGHSRDNKNGRKAADYVHHK